MSDEFNVESVSKRANQKAIVGLWGPSGCGKTLSSFYLARGLVGEKGVIGVIDTEDGRARDYAGRKDIDSFEYIDFAAVNDFSPERLSRAYKVLQEKGVDCIIIDSFSAIWTGPKGVSAKAKSLMKSKGPNAWPIAKEPFYALMKQIKRAPVHTILSIRAGECLVSVDKTKKNGKKGTDFEKHGIEPKTEKDLIYDLTVSVLLGHDHKPMSEEKLTNRLQVRRDIRYIKVPDEIKHAITPDQYLSVQTGHELAAWSCGQERNLIAEAFEAAKQGMSAYKNFWSKLSPDQKKSLIADHEKRKAIAQQADQQAASQTPKQTNKKTASRPFNKRPDDPAGSPNRGKTSPSSEKKAAPPEKDPPPDKEEPPVQEPPPETTADPNSPDPFVDGGFDYEGINPDDF